MEVLQVFSFVSSKTYAFTFQNVKIYTHMKAKFLLEVNGPILI